MDGMEHIMEILCHQLTTGSEYNYKMVENLNHTLAL